MSIHIRAAKVLAVLLVILAVIFLFMWGSEHYPTITGVVSLLTVMIALSYVAASLRPY